MRFSSAAFALLALLTALLGLVSSSIVFADNQGREKKTGMYHVFQLDGEEVRVSELDLQLFAAVLNDVKGQLYEESLAGIGSSSEFYSGQISVSGAGYSYEVFDGQIWVDAARSNFATTIPAGKILNYLEQLGEDRLDEAKCPWCGAVVVIYLNQFLCSATEGGSHAYCQATCRCGVEAVESVCIAGARQTSCVCTPCEQTPTPPSLFPLIGDWAGPLTPVTLGGFGDGPFIIPR